MNTKKNVKRFAAIFACVVVLCMALALPSSAVDVNSTSYWSASRFPLIGAESLNSIGSVYCYVGLEETSTTISDGSTNKAESHGAFNIMFETHTASSIVPTSIYVFKYNVVTYKWQDCSNQTIPAANAEGVDYNQIHINGNFLNADGVCNGDYTYKQYFMLAFVDSAAVDSTSYKNFSYSLYETETPFAVRWATTDGTRYCYFGITHSKAPTYTTVGQTERLCPTFYLANTGHPAQTAKAAEAEADASWTATYNDMVEDYEQRISDLGAAHQVALQEEYDKGYSDGSKNATGGISVDTSDPANTVLGFFAVLFKGIRDFVFPFFEIEVLGVPIMTVVAWMGVLLFVAFVLGIVFTFLK